MREPETGAKGKLQEIEETRKVMPLAKFLKSIARRCGLTRRERLRIVDQALLLLEMNYVHLPLKQAMHAINPIQRLKLLKFRLETKGSELEDGMQFHRRLLEIFSSLRDMHTLYLLPTPFRDQIAFLPFLIEQYFESDGKGGRVERFLISRVLTQILDTSSATESNEAFFQPGVDVLYWNGVPIRRAIEINGESQAGSNVEARFARGLDNLTVRPLDTSLPPDEKWVDITYQTADGEILTLKVEWLVYNSDDQPIVTKTTRKKRAAIDIKKTKINEIKRRFFAPPRPRVREGFEKFFYGDIRKVAGKEFGYVRLFSFDVDDAEKFVDEFRGFITAEGFPQTGLIIDVRGNPGGKIRAGERLLQLFTPRRVKPELFEFINSSLNLELCRRAPKDWNLNRWANSISEAVITGATYSLGFPLNSEESCNDIGQVYYGPVILITDALSYSTTDMFAAGFQDNEVGNVLGASDNTGAGGANNWHYGDLIDAFGKNSNSIFKKLPRDSEFVLAMRRSLRVGARNGRPLEELGILPDYRYYMTKNDLINRNSELVRRAARLLEAKPIYSLSVSRVKGKRTVLDISAESTAQPRHNEQRISRLDISIDSRPFKTLNAKNGRIRKTRVALAGRGGNWSVQAFDFGNNLVAAARQSSVRRAQSD